MATVHPDVLDIACRIAERASGEGAVAVMLVGSHVRGEAHEQSDIDLIVIGEGPDYVLERHAGHLVSLSWRTPVALFAALDDPATVGGLVPALREALILSDRAGEAVRMKEFAATWEWGRVEPECDTWVADQITGLAEEVHRLVGCLDTGNTTMAAVVRSVLATRLAAILSVHLRLLYGSENLLWDMVSQEMGSRWAEVQSRALGMSDVSFRETCNAALELYVIAADEARHLLSDTQREVVEHACAAAGHPMGNAAHRDPD